MTSAKELSQFVGDMLASPPRAGDCVNLYLFLLARVLHPYDAKGRFSTRCAASPRILAGGQSRKRKSNQPRRISDRSHGRQMDAIRHPVHPPSMS